MSPNFKGQKYKNSGIELMLFDQLRKLPKEI